MRGALFALILVVLAPNQASAAQTNLSPPTTLPAKAEKAGESGVAPNSGEARWMWAGAAAGLVVLGGLLLTGWMKRMLRQEVHQRQRAEAELEWARKASKQADEISRANVALTAEIEERKRMEDALRLSERRFALAMEAANDGLWDWNIAANKTYLSQRYYTMLGYGPNDFEANRKTWLDLMHPDDRDKTDQKLQDYVQGLSDTYEAEFRLRSRSGHWVWVLSKGKIAERDSEGRPVRVVGTHSDITERKKAEERAAEARDELEVRVRERTEELEQAKQAAEAASEAKSRFLAVMSHEIRTPLNGVTGVLHILSHDNLTPHQRKWLDMALTSADILLRLINDILDFSKVEAGNMDLKIKPFDLHLAISRTGSPLAQQAAAKGLAWNIEIDPAVPNWVSGDGDRVMQVLGNLMENALKFTDRGAIQVLVQMKGRREDRAVVRFMVTDTGPGIKREDQKLLFKPFSQVDSSSTRRHGGTGLGLGICRQLVDLMGGKIDIQSEPGHGSTFWFELPFETTAQPASPNVPTQPLQPLHGRVLLAEDNENNRELAIEMISATGCVCDFVMNGDEAVKAASKVPYCLIFMDCMMPVLDGFEATKAIRRHETEAAGGNRLPRHIPIIAMTARAMSGDRELCLAAGMDDYMTKPLHPDEVARMVRKWWSPNLLT